MKGRKKKEEEKTRKNERMFFKLKLKIMGECICMEIFQYGKVSIDCKLVQSLLILLYALKSTSHSALKLPKLPSLWKEKMISFSNHHCFWNGSLQTKYLGHTCSPWVVKILSSSYFLGSSLIPQWTSWILDVWQIVTLFTK